MALDHFKDENYQGTAPWWNFNVLFNGQTEVHQMAQQYAPLLDHLALYPPIPPQWLHATVLALGPVSDYSEQEIRAVTGLLRPELAALELPRFVFDPWWLWGGVVLHISPEDHFTKIYDCVIKALQSIVGPDRATRTPHGSFLPHMTLAYTRAHQQEIELHKRLQGHPVPPASFNVDALSLLKQTPKDGHYEWIVIEMLPIGLDKA